MQFLSKETALYVKLIGGDVIMEKMERWRPRCIFCQASGPVSRSWNGEPGTTPRMTGRCPYSPDNRHQPRWEKC